jgi:hypothetical protein
MVGSAENKNVYIRTIGIPKDNQVNKVVLGVYELPLDVLIILNGNKMIAQSQILDGVAVFERVTRKPFDIDFDFTLRETVTNTNTVTIFKKTFDLAQTNRFIFPLESMNSFFQNVWKSDEVLRIDNAFLNKIGINQVVLNDIQITTIRGNTDIGIKIKTIEDFYSTRDAGTKLLI